MVGTVPIMVSTALDALFEDLPVLIVEDWSVVTEEFLNTKYVELQAKSFNFDICYSSYWEMVFASDPASTESP